MASDSSSGDSRDWDCGGRGFAPPCARRNWTWAALMRRAFALDVLACPRCGGRLRVIATVEDPVAVRQLLAAQRLADAPGPGPPAPRRVPAITP